MYSYSSTIAATCVKAGLADVQITGQSEIIKNKFLENSSRTYSPTSRSAGGPKISTVRR